MQGKSGLFVALLGLAQPVFAQYAGPAILSRGEAPSSLTLPNIKFRPYVSLTGTYNTAVAGVSLNDQGQLGNLALYGTRLSGGVSGLHNWRRTRLGLDYRGSISHYYGGRGNFDATDHSMLLGVTHRVAPHATLNVNAMAGVAARDFGLLGLSQTLPFDPVGTDIPVTDYFNNRTLHAGANANLLLQKTMRLSFSLGGGMHLTRRRSRALFGNDVVQASGDVQYRLTGRTTIGASYGYGNFTFTRLSGATDVHSVIGTFGMRLTRLVQFSGYAGVMRPEMKFLQTIQLDPVIQELLGVSSGTTVVHRAFLSGQFGGRFSREFQNGVAFFGGSRRMNPGNGLFLTSISNNLTAGYAYTGLRRWSLRIGVARNWSESVGNVRGKYETTSANISTSRTLRYQLHFTMAYSLRQYQSGQFENYNRLGHFVNIGLSWSPGELPLRIW